MVKIHVLVLYNQGGTSLKSEATLARWSLIFLTHVCPRETMVTLTYSATHEQESTIQLFATAKCPCLDIILQLAHAFLSKLMWPMSLN